MSKSVWKSGGPFQTLTKVLQKAPDSGNLQNGCPQTDLGT